MSDISQPRYTTFMYSILDEIYPNASKRIEDIDKLPIEIGIKMLSIIISYACQAQNTAIISIARMEFSKIPKHWVIQYIDNAVNMGIDLNDEWDYRRLLELISESKPYLNDVLKSYISKDKLHSNLEIREAAEDFEEELFKDRVVE